MGALLRWGLSTAVAVSPGSFPWTTFAINVVGSALLALLPAVPGVRGHPLLALALGTGVLGGFTTLSTYSEETRALLAGGHPALGFTYLLATLAACLAAVALVALAAPPADQVRFAVEEGDE